MDNLLMAAIVGVIANPRAGKDIRRLVAYAPAPSDTSRIADLRRLIVGASEGGADKVLLALDAQGLAERATLGLNVDVELVDIGAEGTGEDTARAAAAMKTHGAGVLAVYGGDGTHRQVARGWRDAPIVAIGGGTNNAFPQLVEPTVAGAAAGLVVGGGVPLEDLVAYQSLVIDVDVEGIPVDLALVDVAILRGDTGGSPSLWSLDGVDQIFTAIAEPWSIGLSALAGLVAPTSRTDDRGVLLDLDPAATQRVRAPIAPGRYVEAGLGSVSVVDAEQSVSFRGPAVFAVDGERAGSVGENEWGSLTLRRNGPRVIDIRRTFSLAVRRGHFYTELSKGS
jgi:hypothetical protein